MSEHKKIVIIIVSVTVAVLLGLSVFLFIRWSSPKDAEVEVSVPDTVQSGVPFPLTVAVSNDSNVTLKDVQAVITLPEKFIFAGPERVSFINKSLGSLEVGDIVKQDFQVISLGNENTVAQFTTVISYVPGAFRSRFEKNITKNIIVADDGVVLEVIPPVKVFSGEVFTTDISYKNITDTRVNNLMLHITYPDGFTYSSSEPSVIAGAGNNEWYIGDLDPGAEGVLTLSGMLSGQTGAIFDFKLELTGGETQETYPVTQKTASVSIASSPLSLVISRGNDSLILGLGDVVTYYLDYVNNTEVGLKDVIITAKLTGEMFDLSKVKSVGALRSGDNTIVWNASRVPQLGSLAPGERGQVSFMVPIKALFPIQRLSSKNFTVQINGEIESPTVPRGVAGNKTLGVSVLQSKIRGRLTVDSSVYFRDATSGMLNIGAVPPKVGQATQYTAHWILKNFATDADNVVLRAFLGANVRFTGQAKTNIEGGTAPTYDERTQEVVWNIGKIPANRGILSPAYEAVFQIELIPSINQAETSPTLVRQTEAAYLDVFTNENRVVSDLEVTTDIPDDRTVGVNAGRVVQ